jgi:hypothetical protein
MTLTDVAGNRLTLYDVCYVPESQDRILSLMKFRREHYADFQFTGLETFVMKAANGFGRYFTRLTPDVNVTATRSTTEATRKVEQCKAATDYRNSLRCRQPLIQNQRYKLLPAQQTMIQQLHLSPAVLEIAGIRDMDMPLHQFTANSISSIQSIFDSRKCVPCLRASFQENSPTFRLSLRPRQKLKPNWNEYTRISAANFPTLKAILSTISTNS